MGFKGVKFIKACFDDEMSATAAETALSTCASNEVIDQPVQTRTLTTAVTARVKDSFDSTNERGLS